MTTATADPLVLRIVELRDELGMTTTDLADRVGIDRSHLWRILTGVRPASASVLGSCLVALGEEMKGRAA